MYFKHRFVQHKHISPFFRFLPFFNYGIFTRRFTIYYHNIRMENNTNPIHIGALIEKTLHSQGRSVTWFAKELCCTRTNVYKIFQKENIDIQLLWRISSILQYDFFQNISNEINNPNQESVSK